ncbi:putative GTA protein [Sulfitobacter noctilucicola]|uniref:Putative phage protein (TIGR02218 family) n=1 Tax=Sulfitobacter noctilucicola TaxID=1342301 RepID=A0A7W6Q7A8_9RHOB|nr:DUF2163 domain-containing protein [Sulfitobacter noctilucicola]KIN66309.1 putative GTA protein [Sulfitobacter noctilucicola]MBB4175660.1 putative phage protein (TIGR02218 family) [Sulfitobacter noctilucicola]
MAGIDPALQAHLEGGLTTVCHAWKITRKDGVCLAFTDHDLPLTFEGVAFRADAGLSARAIAQTTGLSVDNTEAVGALSDASIREDEIEQGRFDGAEVQAWLVNWADVSQRWLQFRGTIGEMKRAGGAFRAELRGLTEVLNRTLGRVYQKPCTAVLGDKQCRFNAGLPGYSITLAVDIEDRGRSFIWDALPGFDPEFFIRGRLEVLNGTAAGLFGLIKHDRTKGKKRVIELWEPIKGNVSTGTQVRLLAGCNKQMETCRLKFDNLLNFQGFPDLPGEDWVVAVPKSTGPNSGGSLR